MAIRADKLFRIIQKTDRNKSTIERYRSILNIEEIDCNTNSNGKIQGKNGALRVISRGPFLSMFKHESKSFVNSLENSARALKVHSRNRRKKKKNSSNSSVGSATAVERSDCYSSSNNQDKMKKDGKDNDGASDSMSKEKRTIVSAPEVLENAKKERPMEHPNSLKRKKTDHVGVVITTEKDCSDEMSAVSVSPTGEKLQHHDTLEGVEEVQVNVPHANTSSRENTVAKTKQSPNMESKKKKKSTKKSSRKKYSSSLSSKTHHESKSQRQSKNNQNQGCGQVVSTEEDESCHNRNNSATESVSNIREIMQANATPGPNKRQKIKHYTPTTPLESAWLSSGPVQPKHTNIQTSMYVPSPYAAHPLMQPGHYGHAHHMNNTTMTQHQEQHPSYKSWYDNYDEEQETDICSNDDSSKCFILDGLVSLFKRLVQPQKKTNLLQRNVNSQSVHQEAYRRGANLVHYPVMNSFQYMDPSFSQYPGMNLFPNEVPCRDQYNRLINNNFMVPYQEGLIRCQEYGRFTPEMPACNQRNPKLNHSEETANSFIASSFTSLDEQVEYDYDEDLHKSSDTLKVYDYEPRIKLPEPGSCKFDRTLPSKDLMRRITESNCDESTTASTRFDSNQYQEEPFTSETTSWENYASQSTKLVTTLEDQSEGKTSYGEFSKETLPKEKKKSRKGSKKEHSKRGRKKSSKSGKRENEKAVPQMKGRSRSLSDAHYSQCRSMTTSSLTRGSSFGSTVSSISASLDGENSEITNHVRLYHYR